MAGTRKPKALLDAEKRITELEKQLKDAEYWKNHYQKEYNTLNEVVDGIHAVLDDLEIKRYRDENKYNQIPLTVRLFSWAMKQGGK